MTAGVLVVVMAAGYRWASSRVPRAWPPGRTAWFMAGCAVLLVAALGLDERGDFPAHVGQHLLLGMIAPALLTLGAPVTLALQASGRATRRRLRAALSSPLVAVVSHPVVVWALFGGSMFVLYLTPLYRLSVENGLVHEAVHAHFLVAGTLFFWAVLGQDPAPRRLPHGARVLMVFLAIPFHAVLGLALLGASRPLPGVASLADQRAGAGLLWAGGDLLGLLAVLVVAAQWATHEEREAAREDRRADREARPPVSAEAGGGLPQDEVGQGGGRDTPEHEQGPAADQVVE